MVQLLNVSNGFWKAVGRCFFGEIGAKTFFLTILLTIWVATWEHRKSRYALLHQVMVVVGALVGLVCHSFLVSANVMTSSGNAAFNFGSVVVLFFMGVVLRVQHGRLPKEPDSKGDDSLKKLEETTDQAEAPSWNPVATNWSTQPSWNPLAEKGQSATAVPSPDVAPATKGPDPAQQQWASPPGQTYGSMAPPNTSWQTEKLGVSDVEEQFPYYTLVGAGILAMALGFIVQAGQQPVIPNLSGAVVVGSSLLGFVPALLIASCIGYAMEGFADNPSATKRLLFAAELGCFALALVCFSEAMLSLRMFAGAKSPLALLGFR